MSWHDPANCVRVDAERPDHIVERALQAGVAAAAGSSASACGAQLVGREERGASRLWRELWHRYSRYRRWLSCGTRVAFEQLLVGRSQLPPQLTRSAW